MITAIFIASLCTVVFMIGTKMYELSKQTQTLQSRLLSRFDNKIQKNISFLDDSYQRERERVSVFLSVDVPKYSKETFDTTFGLVSKKYQSLFPNIRGVRALSTERDASDFLQTISSERYRDGKGSIEDMPVTKSFRQAPES